MLEDQNLAVPLSERLEWLSQWHSEFDWLRAVHKTKYSNGILALHEEFLRTDVSRGQRGIEVFERFEARTRQLAEPDLILFANDHWNFNVRGFNPGGNHGSMFRISTHSVWMAAGGAETHIPRGRLVEEPYDSLSFVPTILKMMGRTKMHPGFQAAPFKNCWLHQTNRQQLRRGISSFRLNRLQVLREIAEAQLHLGLTTAYRREERSPHRHVLGTVR